MSKFTPGPWKIMGTSSVDKKHSNAIVVCPDGRSFDCGDLIYHPENYDNANLISKAPEMYDMIEDLRKVLITVYDEPMAPMIDKYLKDIKELQNQIRGE